MKVLINSLDLVQMSGSKWMLHFWAKTMVHKKDYKDVKLLLKKKRGWWQLNKNQLPSETKNFSLITIKQ